MPCPYVACQQAKSAQTDLAAWLIGQGRFGDAAPLLVEAGATLESLGATPALARTRELAASLPAA
jgi:hypothetical protein